MEGKRKEGEKGKKRRGMGEQEKNQLVEEL